MTPEPRFSTGTLYFGGLGFIPILESLGKILTVCYNAWTSASSLTLIYILLLLSWISPVESLMSRINTKLTRLLGMHSVGSKYHESLVWFSSGIRTPVVAAPMAGAFVSILTFKLFFVVIVNCHTCRCGLSTST